jgi:hypothetical protein
MTQNQPLIPLADAISELRAELITSMKQAANQELQFRLKPVELEFQVAVTKSADGNAGVRFWVVDVGGKGSYENAMTHTIKLTLEPVGDIRVSQTGVERPD